MKIQNWMLFTLLTVACATSPTGRKQIILVPDSQMNQMGLEAFAQMKQQIPRSSNPQLTEYVNCVARPITKQVGDKAGVREWELVVFEDPTANAFALPGGKIGVHVGLLQVAKTPDQLAAVLGHEVGHVIARHGAERVSEAGLASIGLEVVSAATQDSANHDMLMGALGLGAQYGVLMPHGRKQESEADIIGIKLMAQAGFDPRQSVELWRNMASAGGQQSPEFLSTHPSHQTRISDLQAQMPLALSFFQQARAAGRQPQCQRPQ